MVGTKSVCSRISLHQDFLRHPNMKRLNIKLAVSLAIGIVVLGAGVHFLHAFQVDRNAEGVFEQAQALYKQGEYDEAYQFGYRYLHLRSEDLRGSKLLADIA